MVYYIDWLLNRPTFKKMNDYSKLALLNKLNRVTPLIKQITNKSTQKADSQTLY